jgi:hypothetical protein
MQLHLASYVRLMSSLQRIKLRNFYFILGLNFNYQLINVNGIQLADCGLNLYRYIDSVTIVRFRHDYFCKI